MVIHDEVVADCRTNEVQIIINDGELCAVLHEIDKLADEDCKLRKTSAEELEEGSSITKDSGNDDGDDEDDGGQGGGVDNSYEADDYSANESDQQVPESESDQFIELDLKRDDVEEPKIGVNPNEDQLETSKTDNGRVSEQLAFRDPFSNTISQSIETNGINAVKIKLDEDGSMNEKGSFASNGNNDTDTTHKKTGFIRHCIAILALSSIVLANINRQAFNQALVSMTKKAKCATQLATEIVDAGLATESPTTIQANTIKNLYYSSYETTSDFAPTQEPQTELDSKFNASKPPPLSNHDSVEEPAVELIINENINSENDDRFDWSEAQVGILQSAFSYGYMPFMIPGGRMSEIYGAKWVVFLSGFGSAICCLVVPLVADSSYVLLVCSRIFMGNIVE